MRLAIACALIAGCSDTPTLAIQLATQPYTIAFRPDGGEWTSVPEIAQSLRASTYEIPEVDGTIAIACKQTDGTFQVEELSATAAELASELYATLEPWPQLDCTPPMGSALVEISGSAVNGGGQLYIGDQEFQIDGDSSFQVAATIGVHDLVVVGQSSVLIRHDQPIEMPYVEPTIDVDAQGVSVGTLTLIDARGGGFVDVYTELITVNGTRLVGPNAIFSRDQQADYFPSELLEPGDIQVVVADEFPSTGFGDPDRFFSRALVDPNQPNVPYLDMLDAPVGATFGSDVSVDFSDVDFDAVITAFRVEYSTQERLARRDGDRRMDRVARRRGRVRFVVPGLRLADRHGRRARIYDRAARLRRRRRARDRDGRSVVTCRARCRRPSTHRPDRSPCGPRASSCASRAPRARRHRRHRT